LLVDSVFATGGRDPSTTSIDLTASPPKPMPLGTNLMTHDVTPDGRQLVAARNSKVLRIDIATGQPVGEPALLGFQPKSIVVRPDGKSAIVSHDGLAIVSLEPLEGSLGRPIPGTVGYDQAFRLDDGRVLVGDWGGQYGALRSAVLDSAGTVVETWHGGLGINKDGWQIQTDAAGNFQIINADGSTRWRRNVDHGLPLDDVVLADDLADGRVYLVTTDGHVHLLSSDDGHEVAELHGYDLPIAPGALPPAPAHTVLGHLEELVVAYVDASTALPTTQLTYYRLKDGRPSRPPQTLTGIVVGMTQFQGDLILGFDSGEVRRVDGHSGRTMHSARIPGAPQLYTIQSSRDDKLFLTTSSDVSARVWDAATLAPIGPPIPIPGYGSASVSPKGDEVVVATTDHGAFSIQLDTTGVSALICARHDVNLSHAQYAAAFGDRPYERACPDLPVPPD
jgi:WD40 repeat protein